MINTTYGILSNGKVTSTDMFYRFSDTVANKEQKQYINSLLNGFTDVTPSIEFIIKLLRSSEYWPEYVAKFDPLNTYDDEFTVSETAIDSISYDKLKQWFKSIDFAGELTVYKQDSELDQIRTALFNLLTLGRNG